MKIIIVGSGLAGLTAALTANKNGNEVIIIEKLKTIGGNSRKASSGINFFGINDNPDLFFQDIMSSGHYKNNPSLVHTLIHHTNYAKQFLTNLGLNFNKIFMGGGHSVPRTHSIHHSQKNIGSILVERLYEEVKKSDIKVITECKLLDINIQCNKVHEILCLINNNTTVISCDVVILASGGYSCNPQLLGKYSELPTTNNQTTTGDSIIICKKRDVSISNIEDIQIHPTSFIDPHNPTNKFKFLAPEALRGLGSVLVNSTGSRFTFELDTRDKVTKDIFDNKYCIGNYPNVLLICDENILKNFGPTSSFYLYKKLLQKFNTIEDISRIYNLDIKNLQNSLQNQHPPYYVSIITPAVHYTMGGITINNNSQVLSNEGKVISGLYACGEVSSGVHGGNRLVGNSLLECVVFGMIAGNQKT